MSNDRFKFRIWDNNLHKFINSDMTHYYINPSGKVLLENGPVDAYIDVTKYPERYVIEQCTSMKDKTGRLIYEGDICLLYGRKYEICWKNGGFGYLDYPICADKDGYIFSNTVPFLDHRYLDELLARIEVVGTIHDNPEWACPVDTRGNPLPKGIKLWKK